MISPDGGRVWNGNDRSLGQEYLDLMGYGDLAFGARSKQIRDRLLAQESFDEAALQAIQLDDDALYMQYWRKLLLETAASTAQPLSVECVAAVEQWGGEAAIDSIGYRIVSDFRKNVFEAIFGFHARLDGRPIPTGTLADHLKLKAGWLDMHYDDVAHDLIAARPMHWLPETYANWDELLVEAARVTEQRLTAEQSLQQATWGQVNTTAIQHPLSKALPWVSGWLDMPARQVPGDNHMPRVQGSAFGASQRLVVSPGREKEGIYHQPGGASGHFLSPFYRTGYEDWVDGTASPLLPGEAEHELKLLPRE